MRKLYYSLIIIAVLAAKKVGAQNGEAKYHKNIHSAKLYRSGDQTSFPAIQLNSNETLELHFDDLDADVKTYYYTFQLCNADWTPGLLRTFEYTKGFQNVRIANYRNSSLAFVRYTHYQAAIPDRNSYPTRSGNYLLKVFLNGDTSQVAFTKRFVVVEMKSSIAGQILQPFSARLYNNAQKLQIGVQTDTKVQLFSPTDLKIVAIQNNAWTTSVFFVSPTLRVKLHKPRSIGCVITKFTKEIHVLSFNSFIARWKITKVHRSIVALQEGIRVVYSLNSIAAIQVVVINVNLAGTGRIGRHYDIGAVLFCIQPLYMVAF